MTRRKAVAIKTRHVSIDLFKLPSKERVIELHDRTWISVYTQTSSNPNTFDEPSPNGLSGQRPSASSHMIKQGSHFLLELPPFL